MLTLATILLTMSLTAYIIYLSFEYGKKNAEEHPEQTVDVKPVTPVQVAKTITKKVQKIKGNTQEAGGYVPTDKTMFEAQEQRRAEQADDIAEAFNNS